MKPDGVNWRFQKDKNFLFTILSYIVILTYVNTIVTPVLAVNQFPVFRHISQFYVS